MLLAKLTRGFFRWSWFGGFLAGFKTMATAQTDGHLRRKLTDTLSLIHQDLQAAKADAIKNDDCATAAALSHLASEIDLIRNSLFKGTWGRGMERGIAEPDQRNEKLLREIEAALETSEQLREAAHIGGPETLKNLMAELKQQIASLSALIDQE